MISYWEPSRAAAWDAFGWSYVDAILEYHFSYVFNVGLKAGFKQLMTNFTANIVLREFLISYYID